MKTHTGIISNVETKPYTGTYRLQIGKIWFTYRAKDRAFKIGDELSVEYDEQDKYKTITSILQGRGQSIKPREQASAPALDAKDQRIIKAVALKAAAEIGAAYIAKGQNVTEQGIIAIARHFEPYLKE